MNKLINQSINQSINPWMAVGPYMYRHFCLFVYYSFVEIWNDLIIWQHISEDNKCSKNSFFLKITKKKFIESLRNPNWIRIAKFAKLHAIMRWIWEQHFFSLLCSRWFQATGWESGMWKAMVVWWAPVLFWDTGLPSMIPKGNGAGTWHERNRKLADGCVCMYNKHKVV